MVKLPHVLGEKAAAKPLQEAAPVALPSQNT